MYLQRIIKLYSDYSEDEKIDITYFILDLITFLKSLAF